MRKVIFLVAGGGFQWESLTLARQLKDAWTCIYVVPETSIYEGSALLRALADAPYLVVPEVSSRADTRVLSVTANLWRSTGLLWRLIKKERPDAAVCVGSSMSIPIALVCRARRVPFYFVESITRTDALSSTGKLLLRLGLVSDFYVQWPEQERLHPRARYRGTVL